MEFDSGKASTNFSSFLLCNRGRFGWMIDDRRDFLIRVASPSSYLDKLLEEKDFLDIGYFSRLHFAVGNLSPVLINKYRNRTA